MMKKQEWIRYSPSCDLSNHPKDNQKLDSHQEKSGPEHSYMLSSRFRDKTKRHIQNAEQAVKPLLSMKQKLCEYFENTIENIKILMRKTNAQFNKAIDSYYINEETINRDKLIQKLKNRQLNQFTCRETHCLLDNYQRKLKQAFSKNQKGQCQRMRKEARLNLRNIFNKIQQQIEEENQEKAKKQYLLKNQNSIKDVSISSIRLSNQSMSIDENSQYYIKNVLSQIIQSGPKTQGKMIPKIRPNLQCQQEEVIEEEDDGQSYYQIQSLSKEPLPKQVEKIIEDASQNQFSLSKTFNSLSKIYQSKLSQIYDQDNDPNDKISQVDQNQQLLSQAIKQTETVVQSKIRMPSTIHTTIASLIRSLQLQDQASTFFETYVFDIKVKIIRILYHSTLHNTIPKVKFIAGDQTGMAVIYTNYVSGIKINNQLDMKNCKFYDYKGSIEIVNHKDFRIMEKEEPTITVNKQVKLNPNIQKDLYYTVFDKKCAMIRQVARKLKFKQSCFIANKMIVKIIFIIQQMKQGAFCMVGDSSNMMMAYIKFQPIKQGDVFKLINVKCEKGKEKVKILNEPNQILYIDSYFEGTKVSPFRLQFGEVSQEVVQC